MVTWEFTRCRRPRSCSLNFGGQHFRLNSRKDNIHGTSSYCKVFLRHGGTKSSKEGQSFSYPEHLSAKSSHREKKIQESIVWFIEDQTFSPSYDLAPFPPPIPSASWLYFSVFLCGAVRTYTYRERRMGWARSQILYDGENAWSSISHSILYTVI